MLIPRFPANLVHRRSSLRAVFFLSLTLTIAFGFIVVWQSSSRAARQQPRQASSQARVTQQWTGYRSASGKHKLRVADAQLAAELKRRGARLIAEYDAFHIFSADDKMAQALTGNESVSLSDEDNLLLLNAGTLDTTSPELQQKRGRRASDPRGEDSLYLVQFAAPVKPEWHEALINTGVKVVAYIPNNAYLIYAGGRNLARFREWTARADYVQWDGEYDPALKIDPAIYAERRNDNSPAEESKEELFAVQLVADGQGNQSTLQAITNLKAEPIRSQFAVLDYVNVIVKLPVAAVERQIALRPDVVSVMRYIEPTKSDERQSMIMAGNLNGGSPSPGDYLNYLDAQGLTQSQFAASNFAVNISDSGIDNGTATPNHFALYTGGNTSNASRVIYNRLEGTPNNNSTVQGCDGHGNLNAHILAGFVPSLSPFNAFPHIDAGNFRYGLGVAPFVKVGATVIFDPRNYTFPNLVNVESKAYNDNARISSNSWGSSVNGGYNIDAQAYDALVRDAQPAGAVFPQAGNQEMVIVFAAGNQGPSSNSVNSPGSAKNVITVGAAENVRAIGGTDACQIDDAGANNANDMADFSGRGPTTDGRRKPEIVAPGTHITGGVPQFSTSSPANGQPSSCYTGGGVCGGANSVFFPGGQQFYTASSGTSHSTPAVAGAAALVRQQFINQGQAPPSPAMTKAVLMNSARYLNGAGANDNLWSNAQGMGEVNLTSAFSVLTTPGILRDQLSPDTFTASGQTRLYAGMISDSTKPFRVTVAWSDAPGSTVGNAWVNNLNLEVTVGGQTYLGNVFSGALSVTGGAADPRNNAESVFIPAGGTGPFVVKITAASIAGDGVPNSGGALDQDFALVVSNAVLTPLPVVETVGSTVTAESCAPGNNAVDPGETVTVNFTLRNVGTAGTANLVATLQPGGGVLNPSASQTYGVLPAGGASASMPFTFTAGGLCGGTLAATLSLQDGANNLGSVTFNIPLGAAITNTTTFTNNASITIPGGAPAATSGAAAPYPSAINVSGLNGAISKVTVTLNNVNHTFPDDVDILLVNPAGQAVVLMSDAGGNTDITGGFLTFDDSGVPIPDATAITSGTYSPADYGGLTDIFPSPAPAGPYLNPRLSVFNGGVPNGNWSLYVVDDADEEVGNLLNGWSLTITTSVPICCVANGCGNITITPPTLNAGTVNTPYSQTFTQTGGAAPVNYSLSGMVPAGLMLVGDTLTGTPTQTGNFNFMVTVVDASGCTDSRNYTLTINCPVITINPATLPAASVSTAYSQTLTQTGGIAPVTFSVNGPLPGGLSLSSSGVLSGMPTDAGTFNFNAQITDANGCTGTRAYSLVVSRLLFYPLAAPVRLLDTRPGQTGCDAPGAPISAGTSRTQTARRTCGGQTIPSNAQAITGNITTVDSGGGYLTLYPSGAAQPLVANSNYNPNEILNNVFTVGLGSSDGAFNIFVTSATHVVIDVTGYYAPPGAGGLYFHPLPKPIRLLETRAGFTGCNAPGAPLPGNVETTQQARLTCDGVTIPTTARAIVGNGTTVNSNGPGFPYLTLFPADATRPLAASSNYLPGQIMNALFTVGLSASGEFKIFPTTQTDMVIDVLGYFSPDATDANGAGLMFNPLPRPVRLLETRQGFTGCFAPVFPLVGGSTRFQLARGICDNVVIANSALAIVGNATVINANGGYLTFWPSGVPQPLVAASNFGFGQILNRHFTVGLGAADGAFNIYSQLTTDLVIDVSGYFAP
jgi:subtilisin-like proprotein convertase family protein